MLLLNIKSEGLVKKVKKMLLTVMFVIILSVLFGQQLLAAPAYPHPVDYQLPDGTTITIQLMGDEKVKWAETPDGYSILLNEEGFYEYAILNKNGDMERSGIRARNLVERDTDETRALNGIEKHIRFSKYQVGLMKQAWDVISSENSRAFPTTGDRKLICILIGYSDKAFVKTKQDFENLFNQVGYSTDGATGSVKDYYLENSYEQFNLTVDVAGPYTAANDMAYYGANDSQGYDVRPRELVLEAIDLADPDVNYADYDNDGDDWVDGVYIIYAGYGEEAGGGADTIWAHAWSLAEAVQKDGVWLQRYSCSAELRGNSGSNLSRIGIIGHEFGHVLGAPDFYDTNYGTGGQFSGTGNWDMMAHGSWNNGGATPAHHNGFTKVYSYNWATASTINSPASITLNNAAEHSNSFYRIDTTTTGEYFFLENREQHLFDQYIPGSGMIIYHVHSTVFTSGNSINVTHPQKMYPVAQNATSDPTSTPSSYGTINAASCAWTGTGKTAFTDTSTPSSKSWAGANTAKPITNISRNATNKTVSFDFMGELPPSISLGDAVDAPHLTWTTGGSANWFGQTATTYDGVDAAQSGPITDSQETWMQTTVTGPGTISFWWKVSSEIGFDWLEFYIGGVHQIGLSGTGDWVQETFPVPAGSQTLRWRYDKDISLYSGSDCGWVDQVVWTPEEDTTGSIQVNINPDEARTAGAQWRLLGPDEEFFHDFNAVNGYHGWIRNPQNLWSLSSSAMVTSGETEKLVTAYNSDTYTDFDYSVRMRRIDGTSVNAIVFRAGNSFNSDGHIYPAYRFGYFNDGDYNIVRCNADGSYDAIQTWTYSSAIVQNGWNTLRVVANGNTFNCFINGTLVRTFTDSTFSSGHVGVTMYRYTADYDPSTTSLQVDWATLSPPPASAGAEVVNPEQEALNEAAMESWEESSPDTNSGGFKVDNSNRLSLNSLTESELNKKPVDPTLGLELFDYSKGSQISSNEVNPSGAANYSTDWQNHGATISNLVPGTYTITFKDIPGWTKPADIEVVLDVDESIVRTGTYTEIVGAPTRVGVHRDNTFYLDADGDLNFDAGNDRYSNFGTPADISVIGDWNGDGYDQIGIRRDNTFYLDYNDNMAWEYPGDIFGNFGVATDTVLIGDWNGDGSDQVGVWREGTFYLDYDGNLDFDPAVDKMYSFGASDGTPITGDWNGDGKDQIGVRSGSNFYLDYDGDGAWNSAHDKMGSFGLATDKILIGDWNGDGAEQIGVHRDNTFYLDYNGDLNFDSATDRFANFGTPDDIPVIGDWNGNGADQIGIRRGPTYYLDLSGNMAWEYPGDIFGNYGISTDKILLGSWGPGL